LQLLQVPYRGNTDAPSDVSTARLDLTFARFDLGLQQAWGGRVWALARNLGQPFLLSPEVRPLATALSSFDASAGFSAVAPLPRQPR
jgi:hypothetical protein